MSFPQSYDHAIHTPAGLATSNQELNRPCDMQGASLQVELLGSMSSTYTSHTSNHIFSPESSPLRSVLQPSPFPRHVQQNTLSMPAIYHQPPSPRNNGILRPPLAGMTSNAPDDWTSWKRSRQGRNRTACDRCRGRKSKVSSIDTFLGSWLTVNPTSVRSGRALLNLYQRQSRSPLLVYERHGYHLVFQPYRRAPGPTSTQEIATRCHGRPSTALIS